MTALHLQRAIGEPWRLSTSQTPLRGLYKAYDICPYGGGFGPVSDDGYGVAYFFIGDNKLIFHVTSSNKSKHTVSSHQWTPSLSVLEQVSVSR